MQGWESLGTFSNEEWVVGSAFKLAWPPLYSAILRVFLISEEVALVHFSVLDLFLVTLKVPRKSGKKRGGNCPLIFRILGSLKCLLECLIMRFLTFFRSIGNSSVRVNLRTLGQPFAIPRDGLRDILLSPSSIEDKMHFPYCYSSSTTSAKDSAFPFLEYVFQEIIFTKYRHSRSTL